MAAVDLPLKQLSPFHHQMKTNQHKEIIRASEIGTYLFCNRAWWLKRVEQEQTQNIVEMSRGTKQHEKHSRSVRGASVLQRAGYSLIGLALFLILIYFLLQIGA